LDTDSPIVFNADNCLGEQSLDLEDIDISNCPALPEMPENARLGNSDIMIGLGAWELGQTAEGLAYKYGSLSSSLTTPRTLNFYNSTEVTLVNSGNLACWAKGYYRLR